MASLHCRPHANTLTSTPARKTSPPVALVLMLWWATVIGSRPFSRHLKHAVRLGPCPTCAATMLSMAFPRVPTESCWRTCSEKTGSLMDLWCQTVVGWGRWWEGGLTLFSLVVGWMTSYHGEVVIMWVAHMSEWPVHLHSIIVFLLWWLSNNWSLVWSFARLVTVF